MNSKNLPVWINCRGEVINDEAGKPRYIIGCMNETGTRQRADNISGLLGEKEMASYLYSQPKELSLIHISEPTRQAEISYAVFCLKKKKTTNKKTKQTCIYKKKVEA